SLRPKPRTYVSTTEPLDPLYDPMIRVDSRYESYFHPTWVTDEAGELSSPFREDYETDGRRRSRSLEETAPGENPFRGPALFPEVMSSGARTALHRAAALGGPVLGPFFGFQGG
ncbi:MAG: hypothetical protein GWM98_00265, partial [Nitrospinaceae bacterium]|nr:hypothetical protein [Nitrospinaceae bacterium]NIS83636.1 hypothetical protein [Nitrospinaceae bacterium]NIT80426.1 hypothetical protein [Nitrospinaceae bacterium]NIU94827.1 hypothetical protein [Nitrospinaceae bacterium]NIY13420.1 hypothetical protein [Nitrospinaceae bacterium]